MSKRGYSGPYKNQKSGKKLKAGKRGSLAEFIRDVAATATDYGVSAYLILLIAVLPFYFTQGYGYIATDKATFFSEVSVNFGKVLVPVLIVYLIAVIAVDYANKKSEKSKVESFKLWNWRKCRISVTDIMVALYGLAAVLSYFCSNYREDALWGAKGWCMGLIPQMILVSIYFVTSRLWKPKKGIFYLLFPASAVVFALGYLNRFGIYPIKMEWSSPSYISTIGNINWYCGYSVIVFFAGVGLFWQGKLEKWWQKLLLVLYLWLGFASLVVQGSFSGIVTIAGMLVILFCLSAKDRGSMQRFGVIALLFSVSCLFTMGLRQTFSEAITLTDGAMDLLTTGKIPIIMTVLSFLFLAFVRLICRSFQSGREGSVSPEKIFGVMVIVVVTLVSCIALILVTAMIRNTLNPGSIGVWSEQEAFTFSPSWGSNRGATWRAGVLCFLEQDFLHKLVGVGPDAMQAYIYNGGSENLLAIMQERFGSLALTNAHNEWLTVLVNLGLPGLVSFVGMIVSAVWSFLRCGGEKNKSVQVLSVQKENSEKGKQRGKGERSSERTDFPVACAIGILAYTINNMFSFQQTMNVTMLFILLGMGSAYAKAAKK